MRWWSQKLPTWMECTMCCDQNRKLPQACKPWQPQCGCCNVSSFYKSRQHFLIKRWVKNIFPSSRLALVFQNAICEMEGSSKCLPFPNLLSRLFPRWILEINTIWETLHVACQVGKHVKKDLKPLLAHIYEWMNITVIICKGRACNLHIFFAHHIQSAAAHSEKHWWLPEREENDGLIFKRISKN